MKIYNYDRDTKEFLNESEAKENPLEKDKFLTPANATDKKPLISKVDFAICFNVVNNAWEYVEDNRDKTYYLNGEKVEFKLGDEITADMSLSQYTDEELFQTAKDEKIALIDSRTGNDIEAIVGDNNKQKDKLALATALTRKEAKGTITTEETATLENLEAMSIQVAQLKIDGNAREAQVSALLLDDFESLEYAILAVEAI